MATPRNRSGRIRRAAVTTSLVAATIVATAVPAAAEYLFNGIGEGNSPGTAVAAAEQRCVDEGFRKREVLRVWSYVRESDGATRFWAQTRCFN